MSLRPNLASAVKPFLALTFSFCLIDVPKTLPMTRFILLKHHTYLASFQLKNADIECMKHKHLQVIFPIHLVSFYVSLFLHLIRSQIVMPNLPSEISCFLKQVVCFRKVLHEQTKQDYLGNTQTHLKRVRSRSQLLSV